MKEEEFHPERIESFAKMCRMPLSAVEKEATIPVKFRRNLFEDGPVLADPVEETTLNVQKQQMFYKPAHHLRAQPQAAYRAMDPAQRREIELLDTTRARQQLLLQQQQEVTAYAQRQQLQQYAQQLVNDACVLAPPTSSSSAQAQPAHPATHIQPAGPARTPAPPPVLNPPFIHGGAMFGGAAPGAPGGFPAMTQEELMQAVRKEVKRLQQE